MDNAEPQHEDPTTLPSSAQNRTETDSRGDDGNGALAPTPSHSLSSSIASSTPSANLLPGVVASHFDRIPTPAAMDSRRQSSEGTASGLTPVPSNGANGTGTPQRTRSILNLTSSTLFGIYNNNTGYDANRDEAHTPWGTGAQTPARNPSLDAHRTPQMPSRADFEAARLRERQRDRRGVRRGDSLRVGRGKVTNGIRQPLNKQHAGSRVSVAGMAGRAAALFAIGVAYGVLIMQLHDTQGIAPVRVHAIRRGKGYLAFWGVLGVLLGTLLPWMDLFWEKHGEEGDGEEEDEVDESNGVPKEGVRGGSQFASNIRLSLGADWAPVVRSIGAFLGIAFGIRKLPWQSTLQLSLTLALVNPVIWYLIDRSKAGFLLSAAVGICGATILFSANPAVLPSPSSTGFGHTGVNSTEPLVDLIGGVSYESIGVATWISSVLFCSCVCFGNIGRRLAWRRSATGRVFG